MFLDYKEIIKLKNNISYQDDVFSYPVSKPRKKRKQYKGLEKVIRYWWQRYRKSFKQEGQKFGYKTYLRHLIDEEYIVPPFIKAYYKEIYKDNKDEIDNINSSYSYSYAETVREHLADLYESSNIRPEPFNKSYELLSVWSAIRIMAEQLEKDFE